MASTGANGSAPVRKTAIITGGASGIGLAMAQYFVSQGYHVAVFDIAPEAAGEETVARLRAGGDGKGGQIFYRRCNVSSWREQADGFRAVHDSLGRIDVVCANAGIGGGAMAVDEGEQEPSEPDLKNLNVNLNGVVFCKLNTTGRVDHFLWLRTRLT